MIHTLIVKQHPDLHKVSSYDRSSTYIANNLATMPHLDVLHLNVKVHAVNFTQFNTHRL